MRGSIQKRYKGTYSLILDFGYQTVTDKKTSQLVRKRKQQWITYKCKTEKEAYAKLTELVNAANKGDFVEPTKLTLGAWLLEWIEKAIKPPIRSQGTYDSYTRIVANHIAPQIGALLLQKVKALDLERYYASRTMLKPDSVQVHHAIISAALNAAERDNLVTRNVARLVGNKPKKSHGEDAIEHCWSAEDAAAFLKTAKADGPQVAAFYTTALDSGARKGELAALRWSDLDFASGRLTIRRTLLKGGRTPMYGPPKNKKARSIELAAETLALLKTHKSHQAEVKLRNRTVYQDHGLMFAKEWGDLHGRADTLGGPLQINNIGQREFARLITAAKVKKIKFHGMRHTCATLLLLANVQIHVVQRRLGHSKVQMTMDIYAHCLPSQQQDAADRLAMLLHTGSR